MMKPNNHPNSKQCGSNNGALGSCNPRTILDKKGWGLYVGENLYLKLHAMVDKGDLRESK